MSVIAGCPLERGFADLCPILTVMHFYAIIAYVSNSAVDKLERAMQSIHAHSMYILSYLYSYNNKMYCRRHLLLFTYSKHKPEV